MPPRIVPTRRSATGLGVFLVCLIWATSPAAAQSLPLERDYPGSGPYECPVPADAALPDPGAQARAGQLASEANQAMVLGEFDRVQILLSQAVELNPSSADLAYRHARVLEDLGELESAMVEYCRAVDLDVRELGIVDVPDRIDTLYERVRDQLPDQARVAFVNGLAHADSTMYPEAVDDFTVAINTAPEWGTPLYNRALLYERLGRIDESLDDYRAYLELAPTSIDPILVLVSERIGLLEGAAAATPNPRGAFALGVVPGLGHYYTGRPVAGTATLVLAGGAIAAGVMSKDITTLCVEEVTAGASCPSDLIVGEITERPYLWYGLAAAATVTIAAAVEAMIKARRRRAEAASVLAPRQVDESARDPGIRFRMPSVAAHDSGVDLNLLSLSFR